MSLGKDPTYKLWKRTTDIYQSKSLSSKLYLKRRLYSLKMKEGESITNHLNGFNMILSHLASINVQLEDEDKCILFLVALLESWKNLIVVISSGNTKPNMKKLIVINLFLGP